jgi:predicted permease
MFESLIQDFRYSFRKFYSSKVFSTVAVLSLALGIGANTALFSIVKAVFFHALPVRDSSSLVAIYTQNSRNPLMQGTSYLNYKDIRGAEGFSGIAAYSPVDVGLSGTGTTGSIPEQVSADLVSGNYFDILGVQPVLGRSFLPEEDQVDDAHPVAIVSYGLWQHRFGGKKDILGQSIAINGFPFTVVGVAPRGFGGFSLLTPTQVWVPTSMWKHTLSGINAFYFATRASNMFRIVGRLKPGFTQAQAGDSLKIQAAALQKNFPRENPSLQIWPIPLEQTKVDPNQRKAYVKILGLLLGIVGLVLLLACTNVVNLLMARTAARSQELSVRMAIGANRKRLIQQLLVESISIGAIGGIVGLFIGWLLLRVQWVTRPPSIPSTFQVDLDWTVMLVSWAISLVCGVLFGLAPALQYSRTDLITRLKNLSAFSRPNSKFSTGTLLLVGQTAIAMVAVVAAGLFIKSLRHAQQISPGFESQNLALISFDLGMVGYNDAQGPEFCERVVERVEQVPGVETASVASHVLLDGAGMELKVYVDGQKDPTPMSVRSDAVGLKYFKTVGLPIRQGRDFRSTDTGVSRYGWAIVNETMANRLWPGQDPIDREFKIFGLAEPYHVIGVAKDMKYDGINEAPRPYFYMYYEQVPGIKALTLYIKTTSNPSGIIDSVRQIIQTANPNLPLKRPQTVSNLLAQALWEQRAGAVLLGIFGVLALSLAAFGIYGITSYSVARSTREMGIRMALGGRKSSLIKLMVSRSSVPSLFGCILGLIVAVTAGGVIRGFLVGISPIDTTTIAEAGIVLGLVIVAASYGPALRIAKVRPTIALRQD